MRRLQHGSGVIRAGDFQDEDAPVGRAVQLEEEPLTVDGPVARRDTAQSAIEGLRRATPSAPGRLRKQGGDGEPAGSLRPAFQGDSGWNVTGTRAVRPT